MEGKFDQLKGRAKEAAGDLTDDDDLKRDGKTDRAEGKVEEKTEQVKDKVNDVVGKVGDKIRRD